MKSLKRIEDNARQLDDISVGTPIWVFGPAVFMGINNGRLDVLMDDQLSFKRDGNISYKHILIGINGEIGPGGSHQETYYPYNSEYTKFKKIIDDAFREGR